MLKKESGGSGGGIQLLDTRAELTGTAFTGGLAPPPCPTLLEKEH